MAKLNQGYSKAVGEVYTEATKAMMLEANDLRVLSSVNRCKASEFHPGNKPRYVFKVGDYFPSLGSWTVIDGRFPRNPMDMH